MPSSSTVVSLRQPDEVEDGYFFVGGRYETGAAGDVMDGSMYVEHFKPGETTRPFPW